MIRSAHHRRGRGVELAARIMVAAVLLSIAWWLLK